MPSTPAEPWSAATSTARTCPVRSRREACRTVDGTRLGWLAPANDRTRCEARKGSRPASRFSAGFLTMLCRPDRGSRPPDQAFPLAAHRGCYYPRSMADAGMTRPRGRPVRRVRTRQARRPAFATGAARAVPQQPGGDRALPAIHRDGIRAPRRPGAVGRAVLAIVTRLPNPS